MDAGVVCTNGNGEKFNALIKILVLIILNGKMNGILINFLYISLKVGEIFGHTAEMLIYANYAECLVQVDPPYALKGVLHLLPPN